MRTRLPKHSKRRAFTLVELLVVLVVLLIVGLLGFTVINSTAKSDLISGGARNVQSFLEGGRDRALHDQHPRGVRFIRADNNPADPNYNIIDSMVYVGPAGKLSTGSQSNNVIQVAMDRRTLVLNPMNQKDNRRLWARLVDRGLIIQGAWIKLQVGNSPALPYTIQISGTSPNYTFQLTKDFPMGSVNQNLKYELDLAPAILPNQEARNLPNKVVIDAAASRFGGRSLTDYMRNVSGKPHIDIMFSPRGTIVGEAARGGRIQLVVRSLGDMDAMRALNDPDNENPTLVLVVTTQTGSVATHTLSEPFNANDPAGVESD